MPLRWGHGAQDGPSTCRRDQTCAPDPRYTWPARTDRVGHSTHPRLPTTPVVSTTSPLLPSVYLCSLHHRAQGTSAHAHAYAHTTRTSCSDRLGPCYLLLPRAITTPLALAVLSHLSLLDHIAPGRQHPRGLPGFQKYLVLRYAASRIRCLASRFKRRGLLQAKEHGSARPRINPSCSTLDSLSHTRAEAPSTRAPEPNLILCGAPRAAQHTTPAVTSCDLQGGHFTDAALFCRSTSPPFSGTRIPPAALLLHPYQPIASLRQGTSLSLIRLQISQADLSIILVRRRGHSPQLYDAPTSLAKLFVLRITHSVGSIAKKSDRGTHTENLEDTKKVAQTKWLQHHSESR